MIFVLVLGALTAFVAAPLYRSSRRPPDDPERTALQARHDVLVSTLRELDLDHATGLLPDDDFERARERTAAETLDVFRQLHEPPGSSLD